MPLRCLSMIVVLLLAVWAAAGCNARQPQFQALLGYGEVDMQRQTSDFRPVVHDQGGGMFGFGFDGAVGKPTANDSSLRLGGRLLFSFYREDVSERIVAGEPGLTIEEFVELSLIVPQFTASYRQILGDPRRGGFVEPGVGLGLSIGSLYFGSELQFGDDPIAIDYEGDEWAFGFALNPFLRAGLTLDRMVIGVEGGYQWHTLDFDTPLGKDPSEWYVGAFFGFTLGPPGQP